MTTDISDQLSRVLRIVEYYDEIAETTLEYANTEADLDPLDDKLSGVPTAHFHAKVIELLEKADPAIPDFDLKKIENLKKAIDAQHDELKNRLLETGAAAKISISVMSEQLEQLWRTRHIAHQLVKAVKHLSALQNAVAVENNYNNITDTSTASRV